MHLIETLCSQADTYADKLFVDDYFSMETIEIDTTDDTCVTFYLRNERLVCAIETTQADMDEGEETEFIYAVMPIDAVLEPIEKIQKFLTLLNY